MSLMGWLTLGSFVVALLVHTAVLFRWGSRVQTLVEQHEEQLNGDNGFAVWRRDVVTPKLAVLDRRRENREADHHG